MSALKLSVSSDNLAARIRQLLRGTAPDTAANVVWQQDGQQVLILLDTLQMRSLDGWLLCDLAVRTDQTGQCTLQFVFFLGKQEEGDGAQAATTINAPTLRAAQVADRWGADIQRVLWDAVLDVIEASVDHAAQRKPGQPLMLAGFHCDSGAIHVDLLVGEF